MINPFSARGLGVPGGASGEETLLTTWLVADGYKMDIDVQTIDFSGYCARYVDNTRLYLIDERWGTEQTRDLQPHWYASASGSDYCHLRLLFRP